MGLRINPMVGAGQIAALSVSTPDAKFGVSITQKDALLAAFRDHAFLTCVHVPESARAYNYFLSYEVRKTCQLWL